MASAYAMVDALKRAGKTPTRASLLRGAKHLNQTTNPFLQPGVTLKTLPTDYAPLEQLRMVRYRNGRWSPFGAVATVEDDVRFLVVGCAGIAALALAGNALSKTQLVVTGATETGASAQTIVQVKEEQTDAAPFKISIYLPTGYIANLGQSVGVQIGTVDAGLQALLVSTDVIAASGTVLVGDKSASALQASATQCTGTATHAAIWVMRIQVAGQTLDVPLFVDPTTAADPPSTSAKLVLCLPNPYAEAQPPISRAPAGAKIVDAKLKLSAGVLTNPTTAGTYLWRSVITPWTANGFEPNVAGTIETQAIVTIPSSLSLKAKVKTVRQRTRVTNSVLLSGKVLESLQGVGGAKVAFFANGRTAGSAMTGLAGAFSKKSGLTKRTTFTATATLPTRETACVSPLPASLVPGGCVTATLAGYKIASSAVTVTPRR